MRRLITMVLVTAALMQAAPRRRWWVSIGAVVGAATLDVLSSRGKLERNGLARGPDGQFSVGRGVALKAAVTGALVLVGRRHAGRTRAFEFVNYGVAGVWTGAAVHNWQVPRAK